MCIAISKPIGVSLPSDEILKNCWDNNDDGAGFAFNLNNKVIIKKGYMTFKDFIKSLKACDKMYNLKDRGVLLHFRIATHGARDASMTHPFPVVDDIGCLKKIEYASDYAVIHNGIITLTSTTASKNAGLSDTALFVKDYLTKISGNKAWMKKKCNIELIEKLIDSKMAILDKFGNIVNTSGFTEEKGIFYSNSSYKDTYFRRYNNYYGDYYYLSNSSNKFKSYGYQDYVAKKMDDSKYSNSKNVPLMKLKSGCFVECGEYSDVVEDSAVEYYIDDKNNLYVSYDDYYEYNMLCDTETPEEIKRYSYLGDCVVYDRSLKEVTFTPDTYVDEMQFDFFED